MSFIGFLIFIVVVCVFVYSIYSSVIKAKNKAQEALSSIDVQLKKRYDLIPNILKIANKFMEHEKRLLEELTQLRTQAMNVSNKLSDSSKKIELDKQINNKMAEFMLAVENYPELKSDQTMVQAMQTFSDVEEHIAAARRFYNSAVLELNNKVEIFPFSLFASSLGITKQDFFEAQKHEIKRIDVADYIK